MFRKISGRLYAFAFVTDHKRLLGYTQVTWVKLASIIFLLTSILVGWATIWIPIAFVTAVSIYLLYYMARRAGYVTFVPSGESNFTAAKKPLEPNVRIRMRATGTFSVQNRSRYVVMLWTEYWQVPLGDRIMMVEHSPGRFLYQFILSGDLHGTRLGHLYLGLQSLPAIEIVFETDWPSEDKGLAFYVRGKNYVSPAKVTRTVYLAFENETDWQIVWENLQHA